MKTIIVGGVAGGMSAATRLRRRDESAEIVVFERGGYVSFANCGLPYYVGGLIDDRSSLLLQTPESLASRFRLDVRVHHEVVSIDRSAKHVIVMNSSTGVEFRERYDHLVLAVGASSRPVATSPGIPTHTLRTVDDVDAIAALVAGEDTASALVVGGGFIGLEAVENLVRRGIHVTLVQRGARLLSPFDPEMVSPLAAHLRSHGVDVRLGTVVAGIDGSSVRLSDGTRVSPDFIVDASGVSPNVDMARAAGLRIGTTGGIWVDDAQRTSDPSIFAVGDGVEKMDAVTGRPVLVTMAGLANRHGRTAADVISGSDERSTPALGTAIVGIFGVVAAKVGRTESELRAHGIGHRVIHTHPTSHASYFPDAQAMAAKLLVDAETDAILGAQIVGREGVDKRIDVIATAMAGGLTATALSRLELAYAPQFGSAKDAVNQLGYVADNLARGVIRTIQWHELDDARAAGATLIDVRSRGEHEAGGITAAVNIPLDELRARVDELPSGRLVVHCQVGQRGHVASRLLAQLGRDVVNLDGGYTTWTAGQTSRGHESDAAAGAAPQRERMAS